LETQTPDSLPQIQLHLSFRTLQLFKVRRELTIGLPGVFSHATCKLISASSPANISSASWLRQRRWDVLRPSDNCQTKRQLQQNTENHRWRLRPSRACKSPLSALSPVARIMAFAALPRPKLGPLSVGTRLYRIHVWTVRSDLRPADHE